MTLFVIGLIFILLFYYFKIFQPTEVLKFLSVALSFLLFFLALFNVTYNTDWWAYEAAYQQDIFLNDIIFNFISDFFRNRGYDYTAVYKTYITIITIAIIFFASRFKASHTFIISSVFLIFNLMQISNQISYYIVNGTLKPNDKLPAVRELAGIAGVNHNTIQKALYEVENLGLIYTNRTNGKFVTDNKEVIKSIKEKLIKERVEWFLTEMKYIGVSSIKLQLKKEESEEGENYEYFKDK